MPFMEQNTCLGCLVRSCLRDVPASTDQLLLQFSESTTDGRQFYDGRGERWTGEGLCQ